MKVELRHSGPRNLTVGRAYAVIGIECDSYRILDDDGEPCLFDPELFQVLDTREPQDWITEWTDGARYAYPAELAAPFSFEDYHEGVSEAVDRFRAYLERHPELRH